MAGAIRRAASQGDLAELSALGVRGKAMVESVRPEESPSVGAYRTREEKSVRLHSSLVSVRGVMVITSPDPEMDLRPWVTGPHAPACHTRVVLAPSHAEIMRDLHARVLALRAEGLTCAADLIVSTRGMAGDLQHDVGYVDITGNLKATRDGPISALHARLDIARALEPAQGQRADPLVPLASLPDLFANWTVGPGPVTEIVLDTDGSWLAGTGWNLVRATPGNLRTISMELMGPVGGISIRKDGRVDVVSGGQVVEVDLERRKLFWGPPRSVIPKQRSHDPGSWRIENGTTVIRGAMGETSHMRIHLPIPVHEVAPLGTGAVVLTDLGLFGISSVGELAWRIVGATHWQESGGVLIAGGPAGVSGYYLPK
jgi:hypothetical protein